MTDYDALCAELREMSCHRAADAIAALVALVEQLEWWKDFRYDAAEKRVRGLEADIRTAEARAEAAEARVKELEAFRIGYDNLMRQRDAFHARAEAAEARVKELEAIDLGAAR